MSLPRSTLSAGFLRASGGVSVFDGQVDAAGMFSPRKRRCFYDLAGLGRNHEVFSAQAEVFLPVYSWRFAVVRFLRASGGVSTMLPLGR